MILIQELMSTREVFTHRYIIHFTGYTVASHLQGWGSILTSALYAWSLHVLHADWHLYIVFSVCVYV